MARITSIVPSLFSLQGVSIFLDGLSTKKDMRGKDLTSDSVERDRWLRVVVPSGIMYSTVQYTMITSDLLLVSAIVIRLAVLQLKKSEIMRQHLDGTLSDRPSFKSIAYTHTYYSILYVLYKAMWSSQ